MKKIASIVVIILIALAVLMFWFGKDSVKNIFTGNGGIQKELFYNSDYGFEFMFLNEIYKLGEKSKSAREENSYGVYSLILINNDDFNDFRSSEVPRETIPVIELKVYKNLLNQNALEWSEQYDEESNYARKIDEVSNVSVGGVDAIMYRSDGLHLSNNYVVANDEYIYVISGEYLDKDTALYRDLKSLIKTFKFVEVEKVGDDVQAHIDSKDDLIVVAEPSPLDEIESPLIIKGTARGSWFFEASFPIDVVDWDGKIIGSGFATAEGDWMTEEFVPFTAEVNFIVESDTAYKRGTVIFKKDNPSGLPENDDALEIPILFK